MNKAIIGIGSNIDPEENITKAKALLAEEHQVLAESAFVVTKPIGVEGQPDFTNGSILIETHLDQEKLNRALKDTETQLGREKTGNKFDPRRIDLDIIVYNGIIVDKDFYKRDFVKNSVLELVPELKY